MIVIQSKICVSMEILVETHPPAAEFGGKDSTKVEIKLSENLTISEWSGTPGTL